VAPVATRLQLKHPGLRIAGGWTVGVVQSFGNCPQYIQSRDFRFVEPATGSDTLQGSNDQPLSVQDHALIANADTFFIASANLRKEDGESYGADVSHRGGRPAFVRIDDDRTLTVPDFIGNFFFNTIGNLQVNPRAGLLFLDFSAGDVLMLRTRTNVIWDGAEVRAFERKPLRHLASQRAETLLRPKPARISSGKKLTRTCSNSGRTMKSSTMPTTGITKLNGSKA
jgi:predicted pyridoxine 5'-phosphate oxidase superfamily flavin-nucleotide-binding protein